MEKYIPLDALVAEIERRMDENRGKQSLPQYFGMIEEDLNILSFLDAFEVKEVDIDKLCEFRENIGFAYPEGVSEYQKHLACYRQGIEDVLKAQKGEDV